MAEIVSHWFEGSRQHRRIRARAGTVSTVVVKSVPPCPHLGPPIERDGVTIKVKCGCNGKEHDQPHAAHECGLPANKTKRCLPTLIPADTTAWAERKPESDIYRLCHGCDRGATTESDSPEPHTPARDYPALEIGGGSGGSRFTMSLTL